MSQVKDGLIDEIVELLATWGASTRPGARELFQALSDLEAPDPSQLLRRALALPEGAISPELRDKIGAIVGPGETGSSSRDRGTGLRHALERLGHELEHRLKADTEALEREARSWATLMDPAQRTGVLSGLWAVRPSDSIVEQLDAMEQLVRVRNAMVGIRETACGRIREFTESQSADAPLVEEARQALQSGDCEKLSAVARQFDEVSQAEDSGALDNDLDQATKRLTALCSQVRDGLSDPTLKLDDHAREVLSAALSSSEGALHWSESAVGATTAGSPLQALVGWEEALRQVFRSSVDHEDKTRRSRAALVDALVADYTAEIRDQAAQNPSAEPIESRLRSAVDESSFDQVLHEELVRLKSARASCLEVRQKESDRIRDRAAALNSVLRSSAGLVPSERLARSRQLLDQVDEVAGDLEASASLASAIEEDTKSLESLVEERKSMRRGRGEARRARLLEQADRLKPVCEGANRKRLLSLIKDLDGADPHEIGDFESDLTKLALPIENSIRMNAAETLSRIDRRKKQATDLKQPIDDLRRALEEDDLPALVTLSRQLHRPARGPVLLRGPVLAGTIAVVSTLALAATFVGTRWLDRQPRDYQLELLVPNSISLPLTVTLINNGAAVASRSYRPEDESVTFSLIPGRYEVVVNERYTGRVFDVPEDESPIDKIPVPPNIDVE